MEYSLNIALIEPEIPQNTGNIARTCAATGAKLHLVGPMGFTITDKQVKRAGLDYWDKLDITYYDSTEEFFEKTRALIFTIFPQKRSRHIRI
jgi:tRNA (cytidine/uridine-2'-O-)-methyltransferase